MTTKTAYRGARIYHDGVLIEGQALLTENGKTLAVVAESDIPADAAVHYLDGGILTPGFIETQANGGGGYLVNDRFDADSLAHILAAHRKFGTVAMLPTFITDAQDNYHRAIASIAGAARRVPGILGGHFEGPFLSPEKKGTHNPAYLRVPDASDFACYEKHADALQNSIISLAPERVPAGTVRRIREMGIRVNAAHTMAGKADMQRAWAEGLGGVTHLYNAMPPLAGRDPAVIGSAAELRLYCGIIADGVHSDPYSLAAACKLIGKDRLLLVTDSMHTIGAPEITEFTLPGGIRVFVKEDRLVNEHGSLAGAHVTLLQCVKNAIRYMHIAVEDALAMAIVNPARYLDRPDLARITARRLDDILWLSDDLALQTLP